MKKLLLFIIVLVIVAGAGVYGMLQIPKKVDVAWTESDFDSYLKKGNITFPENKASIDDILTNNYRTIDVSEVDAFVSNEEITAMINKTTNDAGIFQDVRMKFLGNDRMEASCVIGDNIDTFLSNYPEAKKYETVINQVKGKSIYMKTTLKQVEGNTFEAYIEELKLGSLPLPEKYVNDGMTEVGTTANNVLSKIDGLSIEKFEITDKGINFKGTIPQQIQSLAD